MGKLIKIIATGAIPFLVVWCAFFLTGFSFNVIEVFQSSVFWGLSVMYWFVWLMLLPIIVEALDVEL
jgi:hypothetical protein